MEVQFTLEEIQQAAKKLLSVAGESTVFAFHGEMGAGKTTFIHTLCNVLNVKDAISSPTFSIINQYETSNEQVVYHMDLYRLKNEEEAISAGVEDCLFSGNLCLVEWPEKAPGIFPDNTLHITIEVLGANNRKMQINL
ncbi:MAG: tRNA (adenosine(37)-N6)-threonylcarbamoyltransferase complex ATPase subunit type 1 TsaE [Sphingobacteriales bacterium]|nr:tRNA (adenosine(37)-N6)-threonylcarbamoyltransferase complex ATPase subunit type 1 TsaE [Sphingobacteriales bacterium]